MGAVRGAALQEPRIGGRPAPRFPSPAPHATAGARPTRGGEQGTALTEQGQGHGGAAPPSAPGSRGGRQTAPRRGGGPGGVAPRPRGAAARKSYARASEGRSRPAAVRQPAARPHLSPPWARGTRAGGRADLRRARPGGATAAGAHCAPRDLADAILPERARSPPRAPRAAGRALPW